MRRLSGLFSQSRTSFQILSELHLSYASQYLTFHIPVSAPYLILAGNTGRLIDYEAYLSFLIRRCNQYERVYLVLGSLEFHGITLTEGMELAARMEREPGVRGKLIVLNRSCKRVQVDNTNVSIVGCTLWSWIPKEAEESVRKKVSEFDRAAGIKSWSVMQHNAQHLADLAWLKREVGSATSDTSGRLQVSASSSCVTRTLVVTAFSPDLRRALEPWQVDSPWSSAYGTNILEDGVWDNVKIWVHGSASRTVKYKVNGTKVVTNDRGRVGEEVTGVLPDGTSEKEKGGLFDVTRTVRI